MDWKSLDPGDPHLINKIVSEYMSKGQFDNLRRQLLSAVDTKPSYQNVRQRMESTVRQFLLAQRWRPDISKNQLRDSLKRQIVTAPFLRPGVKRIVDQISNSSAMNDLRLSLENITRDLLGVKDQPELMDTQNDDEVDNNDLKIASGDTDIKEELPDVVEEKQVENKLIDALENLGMPGEEVQSVESISNLIDTEIKLEPEAMETEPEPMVQPIEGDLSGEDSDHSIINQMSPISAGTVSPPPSPLTTPISIGTPLKRASDFVGKIPKVRKDDEKSNEDMESEDIKEDLVIPKNGESEERKSKSDDKRYSSDKSRDRDKKIESKSHDRSKERRRESDRRNRSKSSNDKDRHRRSDSKDKNKEKYRDKERNRHKDKYSTRDSHRSRDSDKNKERTSSKEKITSSSREKNEKVQNNDSISSKVNNEIEPNKDSVDKVEDHIEDVNSEDKEKITDETSQGSQNSDKAISEKRVFKISPMTTRSKGRRKENSVTETVSNMDSDELKATQEKKKGKSSVKR